MKVNLNDTINYELTEAGKTILNNHYTAICEACNFPIDKKIKELIAREGKSMSLWRFMQIFGTHIYAGCEIITANNKIEILGK